MPHKQGDQHRVPVLQAPTAAYRYFQYSGLLMAVPSRSTAASSHGTGVLVLCCAAARLCGRMVARVNFSSDHPIPQTTCEPHARVVCLVRVTMAKGSKASQGAGPAAGAGAAASSDSDSSGGSQSWDKLSPSDADAPARPNWLLLSVVINLLLLGACVETYVTRMSVGDVVQRLETVIDVQLEKEVRGGRGVYRASSPGDAGV